MAFINPKDLKTLYKDSKDEALVWRKSYPAFERLMNNDLIEGLDPNLPEVNDGSLAAALFKLPKRVVPTKLSGTIKATNRDEAWLSELAGMQWENEIIPNANTQAPFMRKWKDAVRKAAGYGSVPLITLTIERDGKTYTDFIVAQPQDVTLEPGKVSDYDSDLIFWDVYFTKTQWATMIEQAKDEKKSTSSGETGYNKWDVPAMETIASGDYKEERDAKDTPRSQQNKDVKPKGIKCTITVQRGVDAPFYMYHKATNTTPREWTNPDPTGDVPIHFLYCYQDFINPYGIGIVKLAGGTQNVLDYMRQADVLATQLGIRPGWLIEGNTDDTDLDSFVNQQDAMIFAGSAKVTRQELSNGVYTQLPARISMYQSSLQKLIPTGDTSASSTDSGDPTQSKTPAGVKLAAANLSIDDEDFKDNLYVTFAAVARSMVNTHFANMEGSDLMKLSDDERQILIKGGIEFPADQNGEMSNQMEIVWDTVRAKFSFTVDPEQDKAKDDADKLEGLTRVAELSASDPNFAADLQAAGKKFNKGELYADMISLTTDNDKIIIDISPEEEEAQAAQAEQQVGPDGQPLPVDDGSQQQAMQHADENHQMDMKGKQQAMDMKSEKHQASMQPAMQEPQSVEEQPQPPAISQEEVDANVSAIMEEYGVDEQTALTALAAEHQGYPAEDVINHLRSLQEQPA